MRNLAWPQPCRKRELNTTPVRWGLAAGPVGGGGDWPGFEATRRATSATRRHWCGGHRRDPWAWLRGPWATAEPGQASHSDLAPQVWRAPEGSAAVPVGGGGAWPGFEATRRAKLAARTARGRAAAHRHTQRPGPTAPGTPVGPQATNQTTHATQTRGSPRGPPRVHAVSGALDAVERPSTQRSRCATTSATWTAFRAAPLRRLSPEMTRTRPRLPSTAWS